MRDQEPMDYLIAGCLFLILSKMTDGIGGVAEALIALGFFTLQFLSMFARRR